MSIDLYKQIALLVKKDDKVKIVNFIPKRDKTVLWNLTMSFYGLNSTHAVRRISDSLLYYDLSGAILLDNSYWYFIEAVKWDIAQVTKAGDIKRYTEINRLIRPLYLSTI